MRLWLSLQDISRPRPPQKALPANPVPGRKNVSRPGGAAILPPTAAGHPQQSWPLLAPAPKVSLQKPSRSKLKPEGPGAKSVTEKTLSSRFLLEG